MNGQARTAGKIYKTIVIGGRQYALSRPLMVGVYGEIEAFIVSRKEDPLVLAVRACGHAPAAMHAAIWEAAMKAGSAARIATAEEMTAFQMSPWSGAFTLWKALDPRHLAEVPDVEAAMRLYEQAKDEGKREELDAVLEVVSGKAEIKNSAGRRAAPASNRKTANRCSADGPESIASSPSPTAGRPNE